MVMPIVKDILQLGVHFRSAFIQTTIHLGAAVVDANIDAGIDGDFRRHWCDCKRVIGPRPCSWILLPASHHATSKKQGIIIFAIFNAILGNNGTGSLVSERVKGFLVWFVVEIATREGGTCHHAKAEEHSRRSTCLDAAFGTDARLLRCNDKKINN
jgi:hypothetical protein